MYPQNISGADIYINKNVSSASSNNSNKNFHQIIVFDTRVNGSTAKISNNMTGLLKLDQLLQLIIPIDGAY